MKNRSVFSVEAQRWIDSFEKFSLTREEKKVVLLGHGGAVFSPQNVIDSLAIVDIDHYRELLEQLQLKGLLTSKVRRGVPSSHKRGGKRNVARFVIRAPQECELHLNELLKAIRESGPSSRMTVEYFRRIHGHLGNGSPYKTRSFPFRRHLRALNLIDDAGAPSARLLAIWSGSKSVASSHTKGGGGLSRIAARPEPSLRAKTPKLERPRTPASDLPEQDAGTRTIFVGNLPDRHRERSIVGSCWAVRQNTFANYALRYFHRQASRICFCKVRERALSAASPHRYAWFDVQGSKTKNGRSESSARVTVATGLVGSDKRSISATLVAVAVSPPPLSGKHNILSIEPNSYDSSQLLPKTGMSQNAMKIRRVHFAQYLSRRPHGR